MSRSPTSTEEQEDAEVTRQTIEATGVRCVLLLGDLTSPEFCSQLIEKTVDELGGLDILVFNAAHQVHKKSLEDLTDEELERTFKTNVYAYFWLARAALAHMKPGSAIIATSSETGIQGSKQLPDYSATKGAINAFTKALAQELIPRQIRVNAVAPGPVWTPLNPSDPGTTPEHVAMFGADNPMGRPGATRGTGAGLRVPRFERRLVLYHRHRASGHGQRNYRRLETA